MGFVSIGLREYVRLCLRGDSDERRRHELTARLTLALEAYKAGALCHCGEPIWVIGSAEAGKACFTCITGESDSWEDYELAEACDKAAPGAVEVNFLPAITLVS